MENCHCRCNCFKLVTLTQRRRIRRQFDALSSFKERNSYLYQLVHKMGDDTDKREFFKYEVPVGDRRVRVCQKAFISIHGITPGKLRTLNRKVADGVMDMKDRRGNLPSNVLNENTKKAVRQHILSILNDSAVQEETNDGKKFNITKMWQNYCCSVPQDVNVSQCTYYKMYHQIHDELEMNDGDVYSNKSKDWILKPERILDPLAVKNEPPFDNILNEPNEPPSDTNIYLIPVIPVPVVVPQTATVEFVHYL